MAEQLKHYRVLSPVRFGGKRREPGALVELPGSLAQELERKGVVTSDGGQQPAAPAEPPVTQPDEPKPVSKPAAKTAAKAKAKTAPKPAAKPAPAEQPKEPAPGPEGVAGTDEQNNPPEGAPGTPPE